MPTLGGAESQVLAGAILALFAATCLAGQALVIRVGTLEGGFVDALAGVLLVNVAVLVPLAFLSTPDPWLGLTRTSLLAFVGAGIAGTLLGRFFLFDAIESIGASRAEPIKASNPFFAVVIAVLVLGERVTPGQLGGIVLVVVGIAYVTWTTRGDPVAPDASAWDLLKPLAAAFFLGLEPTFAKIGFAEGTPPIAGLAVKSVVAVGFVGAYLHWETDGGTVERVRGRPAPGGARDPDRRFGGSWTRAVGAWLRGGNSRWFVVAGIINTAFLLAYYTALEVAPVGVVVPVLQVSPLLVALFSFLLLGTHERVTKGLVLGASVVVLGSVAVVHYG